jgi:hypothetical protein
MRRAAMSAIAPFARRNESRFLALAFTVSFDGVGRVLRDGQNAIYRAHAERCVEVAQRTADSEAKLALLEMARAWLTLAVQNNKNSQTALVYETSLSRQHVAQQQQQPQVKPEKD